MDEIIKKNRGSDIDMSEEEKNYEFKMSVPLITEEDIRNIDNNFDYIVNEFNKQIIKDKELAIAQYIIQKQQAEIEELKALHIKSTTERVMTSLKDSEKHKEDLEMLYAGCKAEIEEKDKIIDLMADHISNGEGVWELPYEITTNQEIKQYFLDKVKGEN